LFEKENRRRLAKVVVERRSKKVRERKREREREGAEENKRR